MLVPSRLGKPDESRATVAGTRIHFSDKRYVFGSNVENISMKYEVLMNYSDLGLEFKEIYFGIGKKHAATELIASRIFQQLGKLANSPTQNDVQTAKHAVKEAQNIWNENPDSALNNYLVGFACVVLVNFYAARAFVARSIILDKDFSVARKTLASLFPEGERENATEELLSDVRLGFDRMIEKKTSQARELFEQGKLIQADHFIHFSSL